MRHRQCYFKHFLIALHTHTDARRFKRLMEGLIEEKSTKTHTYTIHIELAPKQMTTILTIANRHCVREKKERTKQRTGKTLHIVFGKCSILDLLYTHFLPMALPFHFFFCFRSTVRRCVAWKHYRSVHLFDHYALFIELVQCKFGTHRV